MSTKHVVCNGAICRCTFGTTPDKLQVRQTDYFINDPEGTEKAIANTMDIGQPFELNSFGTCTKMNNSPCKPAVTKWDGFYDKVGLQNGGKVLLEDSKATCAIGSASCIEIIFHGQVATPTKQQAAKADEQILAILNPLVNIKEAAAQPEICLPIK